MKQETPPIPKFYQVVSQLSSAYIVGLVSLLIYPRIWLIYIGALVGWLISPLLIRTVSLIVSVFFRVPQDEDRRMLIWYRVIIPITLILLGIAGIFCAGVLYFKISLLTDYSFQKIILSIAIMSVAFTYFSYLPKKPSSKEEGEI